MLKKILLCCILVFFSALVEAKITKKNILQTETGKKNNKKKQQNKQAENKKKNQGKQKGQTPIDENSDLIDVLKEKTTELQQQAVEKFKTEAEDWLEKKLELIRNDYDSTNFNYSIAVSDNTESYEESENSKKLMQLAVGGTDYLGLTQNKSKDFTQTAKNYTALGSLFFATQKYANAEYFFDQAQQTFEKNKATKNIIYAQILANKGLLYETVGRYAEAEKFTTKALNLRKTISGENSAAYMSSLNNLAMLYKNMGKYSEAEKLIAQARALSEKLQTKNSIPAIVLLNNQAIIYQILGRTDEASAQLLEVVQLAEPLMKEKTRTLQQFETNLALLLQEQKKYAEAEKLYLQAIKNRKTFFKLSQNAEMTHLKLLLAALYAEMGKIKDAEKLLLEAKSEYRGKFGEENLGYANALSHLGNLYKSEDRLKDAEKLLKNCLEIRQVLLSENHPLYVKAQEDLALLYWLKGDMAQASDLFRQVIRQSNLFVEKYFPAMSEQEKEKYLHKLRPTHQRFFNFALAAQNQIDLSVEMYELHLATKALILSSSSKIKQQILGSKNANLMRDYDLWVDLKANLANLYLMSKAERAAQRINLDSLETAANQLEKQLSLSANYFKQEAKVSYQQILSNLTQNNEAIVDILTFPAHNGKQFLPNERYLAFVAGKEDLKPRLIVRNNGEELNGKYLKNYLNAIKFQRPDQYSYAQYWQDIEAATANKTQLYVSLDGVYNQISLNTLQNPKTEKYVVDEKTLIFLTNMKDLLAKETKKQSTSKDIVLIGNPFYGLEGKIPALPGTKVEIEDIAKIMKKNAFKVTQITGKDANETAIKHFSKSPFILHIATHGFFVPDVEKNKQEKLFGVDIEKAKQNPMLRSGLMLADAEKSLRDEASPELKTNDNGILTAYEMMSLHLENTFLVSMSACETGLGEVKAGEGVYGLQRGVQLAGCPNIMMSLWKVSDTATQKFMSLFFTYYTESNNKITAFSQAMRELKKAYPEPYFWGAFVLIGK